MLKKILFGVLTAVVVGAVSVSAYNAMAGSSNKQDTSMTIVEPSEKSVCGQQENLQETPQPPDQEDQGEQIVQETAAPQAAQESPGQQYGQWQAGEGSAGSGNNGGGRQGPGAGGNGGKRWRGGNSSGASGVNASPDPQNEFIESLTYHGVIRDYLPPTFVLVTDKGQEITVQSGNQYFLTSLGLSLSDGDAVTLVGFWDGSGAFSISQITLDSSGVTYQLRDELGRPLWRGGSDQ